MSYEDPSIRYHHTFAGGEPPPPQAPRPVPGAVALQHLTVKTMAAQVRSIHAERKANKLEQQVQDLSARLANLDEPVPDAPAVPDTPAVAVDKSTPRAHGITTPADTAWVIDDWRQKDWTS